MPSPICFRFEVQLVLQDSCFARDNAGKSRLARIAMMAMTTNNSINVKARFAGMSFFDACAEQRIQSWME